MPDPVTMLDDRRRRATTTSSTVVAATSGAVTLMVIAVSTGELDEDHVRDLAELHLHAPLQLVADLAGDELAAARSAPRPSTLTVGPLHMDLDRIEVSLAGRPIDLTHQEFLLLRAFMAHPRRVLSRIQLLGQAWDDAPGPDRASERTVDVHVRRLRAKLGDSAPRIVTVRRFGYRLEP